MVYQSVNSHRSMTFDGRRNNAYYKAMRDSITPDSVVLDLGSGTGIHGFLAAKLGAKRVYCVEPQDIIGISREIAAANELPQVEFIQGKIEDIELP